jgi:hypothetical protein
MGIFRFIGEGLGRLWRVANFWRISPVEGVRTGSALAGGLMFLFMLFLIIGVVLVMLGFDLGQVDAWLERQYGWLDLVGKIALRIILGLTLIACVALVASLLFERKTRGTPGWLGTIAIILGCLMVSYCSAVNIFAPLD